MSLHVPLRIHRSTIDIHIFLNQPDSEMKARGLAPSLQRMPEQHVQRALVNYPIFILKNKPGRGPGGGTWRASQVRAAFWGREAITGVPDVELDRLVIKPGKGLIGIPQNRWTRTVNRLRFTLLHEVGHAVDYELNLSPPDATVNDFRGVRPTCGAGSMVKRHVVEAYARFILRPGAICRDSVDGETANASNLRVIRNLRRSPAFSGLPRGWRPGR